MGLRQRHKFATEGRIRRAAWQLVSTHGLDHVTIEMISAEAGISPRTFFNHFSHKEAALIAPPPEFSEDSVVRFVAGKGKFLDELIELFTDQIREVEGDRELLRTMFKISEAHPKIKVQQFSVFHKFDARVAAIIARRLKLAANDQKPILIAAVAAAAIRVAMKRWAENPESKIVTEVTQSLQMLADLFDEPDAPTTSETSQITAGKEI